MSSRKIQEPPVFEPEFVEALRAMFEDHITFNRVMGLRMHEIGPQAARGSIEMKPELIGHYLHNRVHGGVISACLDAMGGLVTMAAIGARHMDEPVSARMQRFLKLGTIDLRVDYLRPGIGERFDVRAEVLRLGSRVATTRMEWMGPDGKLQAVAMGAYIVS